MNRKMKYNRERREEKKRSREGNVSKVEGREDGNVMLNQPSLEFSGALQPIYLLHLIPSFYFLLGSSIVRMDRRLYFILFRLAICMV
jgi:hypothetical protein